jgi:hypothetical protein
LPLVSGAAVRVHFCNSPVSWTIRALRLLLLESRG